MSTGHIQKYIKVNAPVDTEIAGLVATLSEFPGLQTIESCQGSHESGPWVCFTYGQHWENHWRDLSEFVLGFLGPRLAHEVGDRASVSIYVTTTGHAQGEMVVRPGGLERTTDALKKLLREFLA